MLKKLDRLRKHERPTRPEDTPTAAERRAIRRGRAAIAHGHYVSLRDIRDEVGTVRHRSRKKRA